MTVKLATIFSGIGAIEQAFIQKGLPFDVVFACDNGDRVLEYDYEEEYKKVKSLNSPREKETYVADLFNSKTTQQNFVKKSYLANYDPTYWFEDVRLLDGTDFKGEVDMLVGGSPCQSFSIIGSLKGFDSTKGTLFYEYIRLLNEIQPKVFIYENVANVQSHDKGRTWEIMTKCFTESGYHYKYKVLNSKDYGIPQSRKRMFVVGFKDPAACENFKFPEPVELRLQSYDFLLENTEEGYVTYQNGLLSVEHKPGHITDERLFLTEHYLKSYIFAEASGGFNRNPDTDRPVWKTILASSTKLHRASIDNYVTTNGRVRRLAPRECLRGMGFADSFKIVVSNTQMIKQAGNSIVVNVLKLILDEIELVQKL